MSPRGKALNPDEHWPDPEAARSERQVSRGTADEGKRFLAVQAEALAEVIRDKALWHLRRPSFWAKKGAVPASP